jgi:DNA-directed RNA polymerase specialized sigma24 family protein
MQKDEQQRVFDGWLRNHYAFTPHDQEDLFQEIATQVWRSIPGFRGDATVTTWIYRVALNAAIAWTQKERRHRAGKPGLDGVEPAIPWGLAFFTLFCAFLGGRAGFAARKQMMERALARRRALESMRAALDEDTIVLPRK